MNAHTMIGATVAVAGLLLVGSPAQAASAAGRDEPPGIRIWTDHGEVYHRGDPVQVYFRTEHDAYVTVLRVDTDGRVRVLFPRLPDDPDLARGGETYAVPGADERDAFLVDDAPGIGYVFAVASDDPFRYDAFSAEDHWSFRAINDLSDGRIHGDPYASLQGLIQNILPPGYSNYDTHLLPYYVNQRYDYPRFLCYDCHTYTPYAYWNPYDAWCPRFSLVVYYNPFYFYPSYWYPTRYYRGTNVVYVRPGLTGSQYVFKSRAAQAAPYVVYRDRRAGGGAGSPIGRGVRGVDVGGVGSVPAPGGRRVVGGAAVPSGGRRTVDWGVIGGGTDGGRRAVGGARPGAAPDQGASARRYIADPGRDAGRSPAAGGRGALPSQGDSPAQPRRGVYIDPGRRPQAAPAPRGDAAPTSRPAPPDSRRYIREQQPAQQTPGVYSGGYAPSYAPRREPAQAAPPPREQPARPTPGYAPGYAPRREPAQASPSHGWSPQPAQGTYSAPPARGQGPSQPAVRGTGRAPAPRSQTPALVRRRR
jgi:hypothetical protein